MHLRPSLKKYILQLPCQAMCHLLNHATRQQTRSGKPIRFSDRHSNVHIYVIFTWSSIVTLCICYTVFLGHSSIYPGLLSKSEIASIFNTRERFGAKSMAAISGANKRNRAQISAIGCKFNKPVWPIELNEHFF